MQKYFLSLEEFSSNTIKSDIVNQMKNVLRCKINDKFLIGYNNKTFLAQIDEIGNKSIKYSIIKEEIGNHELPFFVSLFQGYPKADKLESIIKYGTQLGIHEIYPTIMKRSIFKLDNSKKENKLERFNKIAKEAAEQSYRDYLPQVLGINKLTQQDFSDYQIKIVCYEETAKNGENSVFKATLKNIKANDKVAIVVGPEGGIDSEEIAYLKSQGFVCVGLGPRILRTETVIFYVLSALSYEWELK